MTDVNAPSSPAFRNKSADSRIHSVMVAKNWDAKDTSALYYATVLVTRTEEWCVEASSMKDAKARLKKGEGHRCSPGEIVAVEFGDIL